MITACTLFAAKQVERVGILDCDMHFGNGTEELVTRLGKPWVRHFTAGATFNLPHHEPAFFQALSSELEAMRSCDLVLYQAGADPHVDDPLGGFLGTEAMRRRDELVFEALAAARVPVVWNLAGGYQRTVDGGISKVLELHENTARACLAAPWGQHRVQP